MFRPNLSALVGDRAMKALCPGMLALLVAGAAAAQSPPAQGDAATAALQRARAFIASSSCPSATARPAAPPAQFADATVREATYHRILIEGCGRRSQRNYLALVLQDGTARMVETLPGNTVTDPILQRDAMQVAVAAGQAAALGCQQIRPVAANVDGPDSEPTAPRRTQPWTEAWILDACGTLLSVPMRFTPTARGTSFTAGSGVRRVN
jgi:hypothetical protein